MDNHLHVTFCGFSFPFFRYCEYYKLNITWIMEKRKDTPKHVFIHRTKIKARRYFNLMGNFFKKFHRVHHLYVCRNSPNIDLLHHAIQYLVSQNHHTPYMLYYDHVSEVLSRCSERYKKTKKKYEFCSIPKIVIKTTINYVSMEKRKILT